MLLLSEAEFDDSEIDGLPSYDAIDATIGARLRQRRIELGVTQIALARALGITAQQVLKYEKARARMSASMLAQIAILLGTPVAFFVDEPAPEPVAEPPPPDGLRAPSAAGLLDDYLAIPNPEVRRDLRSLIRRIAGYTKI